MIPFFPRAAFKGLPILYILIVILGASSAPALASDTPGPIAHVYTEDRLNSVEPEKGLPEKWAKQVKDSSPAVFSGSTCPGEYYVFQVGIHAMRDTGPLSVEFSELRDKTTGRIIPAKALDCLSLGGVGPDGKSFEKTIIVPKGKVQILWIAVDVPSDVRGDFLGTITLGLDKNTTIPVTLSLTVAGDLVAEHGDHDPKKLSRLR
ncbi:MAG: DUF6067 family protein, partial [Puniceicoccales bacterium]|nr:DUF6067 family protein [Puniceicoccales bacterium]